jgi:murein DD-endopeptidase / murein LD-carboxypeptidase
MSARTGFALILCLALVGQAEAKTSRKSSKTGVSKKSNKKPRHRFSRDKIRDESIALWPRFAEFDGRIGKVGVPELDRLLVDRPPLGELVTDNIDSNLDDQGSRRLAAESRDRGVSGVAVGGRDEAPLERLKRVAEPLLGSPYRTGGESTDGFDCSGFVKTVLRAFGHNLSGRSSPAYFAQGVPVDRDHLQTGDLLFFADHHRTVGHVAIYLAEGKFVHASVQRGVIVSDLDEPYYRTKYKGARRQPEFTQALTAANGQVADLH